MTHVIAALPAMDRASRLTSTRSAVAEAAADAVLVTKLVNLRWLTGFTGSAGMLLLAADRLVFITDGRYREQATGELQRGGVEAEIVISSAPADTLAGVARSAGLGRIALEADDITWANLLVAQSEWFPDADLVATNGLIESIRAIKEPAEVARVEAAARIADAALGEVVATMVPGITELDIAGALDSAMRRLGAEEPAFDTIVASGPNSALPHHHPSDRPLQPGDLVVIDMGATVDGYRSDMTRSFVLGEPDDVQRRLLDVVGAAQAAGVAAVAAGVATRDVDAAARSVIADAGWADEFVHPTGHGVGLEIHEPLRLAATSGATLAAGHIVTVEPGVYLPGIGGVRIEDTVEVTAEGCRTLTHSSLPAVVG